MPANCYGIDYGYVCHLKKLCRHVTPEATPSDAMRCDHLDFVHFRSHPSITLGAISSARREAEKRRVPEVIHALTREYARMLITKPARPNPEAPAAEEPAALDGPIGQTMDLFA